MHEIYIGKQALDREELLYMFWNFSQFKDMREEMIAYMKREKPSYSDTVIKEAINQTLYQIALTTYKTYDTPSGDWLGLLESNYFQRQFNGIRLQSNGKTLAENLEAKAKEDRKDKALGCLILLAIPVVILLLNLILDFLGVF